MTDVERYIIATAFASSDRSWDLFVERAKFALDKLAEAEKEVDDKHPRKKLSDGW